MWPRCSTPWCAAGQPLVWRHRRWLPAAARLGAGVRDTAAGRGGGHRLLRGGAEPPLADRRRASLGRQPVGQGHPAPTRQDRRHRRRSRRPSGACWSGDRDGKDRRRAGGDGPDVQARQGCCGQVPHPGDQPAQGRAGGRRPSAARVAVWAEQPGPLRRCAQLDTGVPTDATSAAAWTLRLLATGSGALPRRSTTATPASPRR